MDHFLDNHEALSGDIWVLPSNSFTQSILNHFKMTLEKFKVVF